MLPVIRKCIIRLFFSQNDGSCDHSLIPLRRNLKRSETWFALPWFDTPVWYMIPDIMSNILSSDAMETEAAQLDMENRLRERRQALALSQKQLADLAGITRQEVSALEAKQYSPATSEA